MRNRTFVSWHMIFALSLLVPLRASAADNLAGKLDAIEKTVDARRQALHIPGVALVVVKNDKIIYNKGLGYRDVDSKLPVTPHTLFAIGSSTKAFTATSVLMCQDDDLLKLTDSPKEYIPYFHLQDREADEKITIIDLLSHQSGLNRTDLIWTSGRLKSAELIRAFADIKPTAKLHERFQYQNLMYMTAGQIVATVQHMRWTDFLAKRIFEPLGMDESDTNVRAMLASPDYALGYAWDEQAKKYIHLPMRSLPEVAPAGAINSNTTDMAKWLEFLLDGGEANGRRLLMESSFDELFKRRITVAGDVGYGLGWFLRNWHGHFVAEHGGNIDGFNAQVAIMPDQHLGFVLLTNVSASSLGSETMETVWSRLVGAPADATASTGGTGAPAPMDLVGTYTTEKTPIKFEIAVKAGKVALIVPGQPAYSLTEKAKQTYRLGTLPDAFAIVVHRDGAGKVTGVLLRQPPNQGDLELTRAADSYTADITVESLMQRVIDAAGGEKALRRHRSRIEEDTLRLDTQGVAGSIRIWAHAPNLQTTVVEFMAAHKPIGRIRSYCDGAKAGDESDMSPASAKTGKELTDTLAQSAFYPELDWKRLFENVKIVGTHKVGDEDCYVVEKRPKGGNTITDYVSKKTFLVLRQDIDANAPGSDTTIPLTATFSDFRTVDGVTVPFHRTQEIFGIGIADVTVDQVHFNTFIPHREFSGRERVPGGAQPKRGDRS